MACYGDNSILFLAPAAQLTAVAGERRATMDTSLARKAQVLRNLPDYRFIHHKSGMGSPETTRRAWYPIREPGAG
jgi:hypothetical protein